MNKHIFIMFIMSSNDGVLLIGKLLMMIKTTTQCCLDKGFVYYWFTHVYNIILAQQ